MNARVDPRLHGVPVIWAEDPFNGHASRFVRAGLSIAEIVATTPGLPDGFAEHGIAVINDVEVPREWWPRVRPRADKGVVVVQLGIRLQGGGSGGGKSTLKMAAMIALLVAAVAIGQFQVLGVLGTLTIGSATITGASLLGAGLATAALAIGAVSPPPSLAAIQGGVLGEAAPTQGVAALSGNVLAPGQAAPQVAGEGLRIFPPLLAPALIERIGLDQYAEAVYGVAGPHRLWEPRLGDTSADQNDDLQIEIIEGLPDAPALSLISRYGYTQQVAADLVRHRVQADAQNRLLDQVTPGNSFPTWSPLASRMAADEIWIALQLEGPSDWNAPGVAQATPFRMRFRRRGDTPWINGPEFHYASINGAAIEVTLKVFFKAAPLTQQRAPATSGFVNAYKTVPAQSLPPASAGWQADSYFSGGSGGDLYNAASFDTHNIRRVALYDDRIELYLDPSLFPVDVYEFQLQQGFTYTVSGFTAASYTIGGTVYDLFGSALVSGFYVLPSTRANLRDKVVIGRIASVLNSSPVIGNDFGLIAVRVKNQSVGQFSIMAASYIPTYNGTDFTGLAVSSNPAEHFRAIVAKSLARRGVGADLIDDTDMVDWRQHCIDRGYKVNAVLQNTNELAALDLIASAGYGRRREAEKIGVTVDYRRVAEAPIMTFTDRNMSELAWSQPVADLPDGYLVRYFDEDDDYRQNTVLVLRPGAIDRGIYEETANDAMTNRTRVIERATFDLRQMTARMTSYTWKTNRKHISARRGSMVAVNHDVLIRRTGSARVANVITSGGVLAGLVLDAALPMSGDDMFTDVDAMWVDYRSMWTVPRYGIALERLNGTVSVHEISVDPDGQSRIVLFVTPIADPGRAVIDKDCGVASGPLGKEYLRLLGRSIAVSENLQAAFAAVDEAPQLFNSDGSIALN